MSMEDDVIDVDSVNLDIPEAPAGSSSPSQALVPWDKLPEEDKDAANAAVEAALMTGDYSKLSNTARFAMVKLTCDRLQVDMTQSPFKWGKDQKGKLMLIPVKNLYQQLRANRNIKCEVTKQELNLELGIFLVEVVATMPDGRSDLDIGVVGIKTPQDKLLSGEALANKMMVAITKAKNRATGSLCGVGGMDDSEVASVREMQRERLFGAAESSGPRMIAPGAGVPQPQPQGLGGGEGGLKIVPPRGGFKRAAMIDEDALPVDITQLPEESPTPARPSTVPAGQATVEAQEEVAKALSNPVVARPEKAEAAAAPVVPKKSQFVRAGAAVPLGRPPKMRATSNPPEPKKPQPGPTSSGGK